MPTLLCVAPAEYRAPLGHAFRQAGVRVRFRRRRDRPLAAAGGDPWGVGRILRSTGPVDGVLVVAPPTATPADTLPGPLVRGVPTGVVFSGKPADLGRWLAAVGAEKARERPLWSVLAMDRRSYTSLARRFARWMREARPDSVETWWSRSLARWEVCDRLALGPRLVIYVGHGRPRGLAGYHGLRWRHVTESRLVAPCGAFVCLACDTLRRVGRRAPFGRRWVDSGRAAAFFGAVDAVLIRTNRRFAEAIGHELARAPQALGDVLRSVYQRSGDDDQIRQALAAYRIVGNPLTPL